MLRIALAQINPTVGDFPANRALMAEYLERARRAGASVVTFPELCLCGYPPEDLLFKPRFLADAREALAKLAPETRGICAVVGFPRAEGGAVFNAAAVLADGEILGCYHKRELPNYGVFDEKRYFIPGEGGLFLDMAGMRLMITICEDVWVPGSPVEAWARECGAQATLNISGSPFHAGKLAQRRDVILHGFAERTGTWVLYNNLVGGQDELVFDGGSLVVDPSGQVHRSGARFGEDLLLCDLDLPPAGPLPPVEPPHRVLSPVPAPPPAAPLAPAPPDGLDEVDEVLDALVLGTRDYVRKNGFSKVVLGLSGGVDSSLVAVVAVLALGAENVVGVTMPSQYTSSGTRSDAERLAANLGVEMLTVPIKAILDGYLTELAGAFGEGPLGVEAENLQARIRGNILMALSNRFGHLVLTTGNKSETAVGYCTLYGDMAGGYAVIKDVPKLLVYRVAERANRRAGRELIPRSVFTRPPSAELRPDQTDQDSLPPYEVLDPIITAYVERLQVADEITAQGFAPEVVEGTVRLVDRNEYKRRQAPPGVKITPLAFGRDRRLPITNHYRPGQS